MKSTAEAVAARRDGSPPYPRATGKTTLASISSVESDWEPPAWLANMGRAAVVPLVICGVVLLALPGPWQWWPVWLAITCATGYGIFCFTSAYHETVHQTLWKSKSACIAVGRLIGTLVLVPYNVYREVHIRHHAYLNTPQDWELWPYCDPRASLAFRRVFAWFDVVLGGLTPTLIYGRIFFHPISPLRDGKLRATIWAEYALMIAFWTTIYAAAWWYGHLATVFFAWLLPAGIAGGCQTVRKMTEHLGMASYDPMLGTRTVVDGDPITRFCSFFHFDIFVHGPHHRHPRIAHTELAPKMRQYLETTQQPYPLYHSYIVATLDMLPYLLFNPGVGMNVGAPPPAKQWVEGDSAGLHDVEDVTRLLSSHQYAAAVHNPTGHWTIHESTLLTDDERAELGNPLLKNFEHYARYATISTHLLFLKLYADDRLLAIAPVVHSVKYDSTRLLNERNRWWLRLLLGPFARSTSYLVDSSLLGFYDRSPIACAPGVDADEVKRHVMRYLQSKPDAESVWFSEPAGAAGWAAEFPVIRFSMLSMAQIDLAGFDQYDAWMAGQSKKRRRNARDAQQAFAAGGGRIDRLNSPLEESDALQMVDLIRESYSRTTIHSPYEDVLNHPEAFKTQPQETLVARVGDRIVAFMSFVVHDGVLWQCHGGLDYDVSLQVKAYHHLLNETVRLAFELGCHRVSFGPLNNETKRRAVTRLVPMTGCLWMRIAPFRPMTRWLVVPNFQTYTGPAIDGHAADQPAPELVADEAA